MNHSTKIKILEYSVAVVFITLLATSYFNLPPSSYFITFYCKLFNTQKYSPLLITSLLSLAYALLIYFIKKSIKPKDDQ
jgi:hypothetical protein